MEILVVNNAEPADIAFNAPLIRLVSQLANYRVAEHRDVRLSDKIGGVIISGVPLHYAFETVDERQPYIGWLHNTDVPVLGICLGHQSIATFFGSKILRDVEAEEGPRDMQILQDNAIFDGLEDGFSATTLHRTSVAVPDSFVALARSKQCANQVMRHVERKIYGMQFHPELSPTTELLVKNFVRISQEDYAQRTVRLLSEIA